MKLTVRLSIESNRTSAVLNNNAAGVAVIDEVLQTLGRTT